jgi:UDP-N-acetylmuramoyl-tripeptide--D-alanyl-D-alanine ligase
LGKTTTKDLVAEILGRKYRVRAAAGNLNNEVGLPVSILSLEPGDDALVVELGVSAPGEMAPLALTASPTVAVITAVAPTHLEFFGDLAAVRREKAVLLDYVVPGGAAVLNADDPLVASFAPTLINGLKAVTYGMEAAADVKAAEVLNEGFAGTRFRLPGGSRVSLALPGP